MTNRITFTIISLLTLLSLNAQITFERGGSTYQPITIAPPANTGLNEIYVVESTAGMSIAYTSSSAQIEWVKYSRLGGAYSEPVTYSHEGNTFKAALEDDDIGYIITDNGRQHCYWIVNYANHKMTLESATANLAESDCDMTAIDVTGSAPAITYYSITGVPNQLSRQIEVTYNTLEWNESANNYTTVGVEKTLDAINGSVIRVTAPLCDTDIEIAGDRFLQAWGRPVTATVDNFKATAIDAHTVATQTQRENDNEISSTGNGDSDLGGSAPCDITFSAYATDAVAYREWQISRDSEFEVIDLRYNQDEVDYTFRDSGTTYVRFVAANAEGTCEYISDTYTVFIGESRLECPNAFSPGASEGVNDEWKVSYKSLVSFECHIFNQWGIELFSTTDPSRGWDGRHGGKLVPAGVYYYVIKAHGSDGKHYSRSGDINIINYKKNNTTSSSTDTQL